MKKFQCEDLYSLYIPLIVKAIPQKTTAVIIYVKYKNVINQSKSYYLFFKSFGNYHRCKTCSNCKHQKHRQVRIVSHKKLLANQSNACKKIAIASRNLKPKFRLKFFHKSYALFLASLCQDFTVKKKAIKNKDVTQNAAKGRSHINHTKNYLSLHYTHFFILQGNNFTKNLKFFLTFAKAQFISFLCEGLQIPLLKDYKPRSANAILVSSLYTYVRGATRRKTVGDSSLDRFEHPLHQFLTKLTMCKRYV
jgi:hypothetical protein